MIAFTAVSVWVYFGLTERISFLEHNLEMVTIEVEENDDWIDNFEPPQSVQDNIERVRQLEIEIAKIKLIVGNKWKKVLAKEFAYWIRNASDASAVGVPWTKLLTGVKLNEVR